MRKARSRQEAQRALAVLDRSKARLKSRLRAFGSNSFKDLAFTMHLIGFKRSL